jgi:hypothetical protein
VRASKTIALLAGAASIVAAVALLHGCEKVIGADFGAAHLVTCNPPQPPSPPSVQGAGGSIEVVAAVYSADLGEEDAADGSGGRWRTLGYDQDGRCTSQGDAPLCHPPDWTGAHPVDGVEGVDNELGDFLAGQRAAFGQVVLHSSDVTAAMQSGAQPPIFVVQVEGYNGLTDDDQVEVRLYMVASSASAPKWDGDDVFPALQESFQGGAPIDDAGIGDASSDASDAGDDASNDADEVVGDGGAPGAPRWVDAHAYVSRYQLVAHFPDGAALRMIGVVLQLRTATLVGTLAVTPGVSPQQWEMHDALLAGIASQNEILGHLPELTNATLGVAVCSTDANYKTIKKYVCSYGDQVLPDSGSGDTCNAFSYGIAMDMRRAKLGAVVPRVIDRPCPSGADPLTDSCATPP